MSRRKSKPGWTASTPYRVGQVVENPVTRRVQRRDKRGRFKRGWRDQPVEVVRLVCIRSGRSESA